MSPLSKDPAARRRQLDNLPNTRGEASPASWRPGDSPALKDGDRTRDPHPRFIDPLIPVVVAEVAARVPIRDLDGEVPPWLREQCWASAIKKLAVERLSIAVRQAEERGRLDPELVMKQVKATESYERSLERTAQTVASHLRAGLDVKRAERIDLASLMAEDYRREQEAEAEHD